MKHCLPSLLLGSTLALTSCSSSELNLEYHMTLSSVQGSFYGNDFSCSAGRVNCVGNSLVMISAPVEYPTIQRKLAYLIVSKDQDWSSYEELGVEDWSGSSKEVDDGVRNLASMKICGMQLGTEYNLIWEDPKQFPVPKEELFLSLGGERYPVDLSGGRVLILDSSPDTPLFQQVDMDLPPLNTRHASPEALLTSIAPLLES